MFYECKQFGIITNLYLLRNVQVIIQIGEVVDICCKPGWFTLACRFISVVSRHV